MISVHNISNKTNEPLDSTALNNDEIEILEYGKNNAFPSQLIDLLRFSHISNRCVDIIYKFIVGQGFQDESINDVVINDDCDTLYDLLSSHAYDASIFEGIYTNITFNLDKSPSGYAHLPFENTRIGLIEGNDIIDFKYNPLWGNKGEELDNENIVKYNSFNDNKNVISEQIIAVGGFPNYNGQVHYSRIKKPSSRFYPIPSYYSAFNWINVDSKIGSFHSNNIDNNFLLSVLLKMVGDPDEEYKEVAYDKEGLPIEKNTRRKVGDVFNERMTEKFSGSENGGKVLVLWSKMKELFPEIESFPSNTNHDLFIALQQLVTDNLVIAFGVPRIISNIGTSGKLGDSNEIKNAVSLMMGNVKSQQMMIENHYRRIFKNTSIPELQGKSFEIKPFEFKNLSM